MYISNGSTKIFVVIPNNMGDGLSVVRIIDVQVGARNPMFNEIEIAGDYIYANSYTTNLIYKFSKLDGSLAKIYDLTPLA
jgi:glutamine cyclotransferase